jgi:dephospho-CoA kinase
VTEAGPAVLVPYDPSWPQTASDLIAELKVATQRRSWLFDHIGSTAVPGLAAKNIIDLQARVPRIPPPTDLDALLGPLGYRAARGARPDSPDVYRDIPRGSERVPDSVWDKRLYLRPGTPPVILHIRLIDSPFARYTIAFCGLLHTDDAERNRYAAVKEHLAAMHANDPDYDDYTRGKTAYLDEVQPLIEAFAHENGLTRR